MRARFFGVGRTAHPFELALLKEEGVPGRGRADAYKFLGVGKIRQNTPWDQNLALLQPTE